MSLELYFHPLSSFCQKVLIALYETGTPFEPHIVDLGDPQSRGAFLKLWPIGKFPVLRDTETDRIIPETTIIIEYLAQHHSGGTELLPRDPDLALRTRQRDRFYDLYVNDPVGKIVTDRLRPMGQKDELGVEQARAQLRTSLDLIETEMRDRRWAIGDAFSMADCAAAPSLFYADKVMPFGESHKNVAAYLARLSQRPSFARVLEEAKPYLALFPK